MMPTSRVSNGRLIVAEDDGLVNVPTATGMKTRKGTVSCLKAWYLRLANSTPAVPTTRPATPPMAPPLRTALSIVRACSIMWSEYERVVRVLLFLCQNLHSDEGALWLTGKRKFGQLSGYLMNIEVYLK